MLRMDDSIGKFCKSMAIFCNNLQNSCHALKESVDRRPIPLDSASTTFVQSLNQRVSSLSGDLNVLESMSCGTVSFEELLGHCNEVFKKNQTHLLSLQESLHSLGYIASVDLIDEDSGGEEEDAKVWEDLSSDCNLDFTKIEDDPLLDDSLNLQNLGLSDVCLATIASAANTTYEEEGFCLSTEKKQDDSDGKMNDELMSSEDTHSLITVSEDDYENLPKHMKILASWQELIVAVEKMNSFLHMKKTRPYFFQQAEITELGLGIPWIYSRCTQAGPDTTVIKKKKNAILIVKGYCYFLFEEKLVEAIDVGQNAMGVICKQVETLLQQCGWPKCPMQSNHLQKSYMS